MFDEKYQVFLADDPEARHLHFKLRYRIYCEERGYEPAHRFPNRMERDPADAHASHFLVQERDTGEWVATMRLVLPGERPFPIRTNCELVDWAGQSIPWDRCGEISRLGVVRKRPGTQDMTPPGGVGGTGVKAASIPEIMFGLFRATYQYCQAHGLDHCLWMSTAGLVRLLKRFDLPMRAIGEPCEFRGTRQPHIIDVEDFWDGVARATARLDPEFPTEFGYQSWTETPKVAASAGARGEPSTLMPLFMRNAARGPVTF